MKQKNNILLYKISLKTNNLTIYFSQRKTVALSQIIPIFANY